MENFFIYFITGFWILIGLWIVVPILYAIFSIALYYILEGFDYLKQQYDKLFICR